MASQSATVGREPAAEVDRLKVDLARLEAYKAVAQYSLKQMGLSLEAAQEQGWVSQSAEARGRRRKAMEASDVAKLAKQEEAPHQGRDSSDVKMEKEKDLRKRIRRLSNQLLIAAAIGKQYREVTMADHSEHTVSGADPAVPLPNQPSDSRGETSMSAMEAISRAFRNWANGEKMKLLRSNSHATSAATADNQTGGPGDTPSGIGGSNDRSLADHEGESSSDGGMAPKTHGMAFRAISSKYGPLEGDDDSIDLANLSPEDVSDNIMATAYVTLAAASNVKRDLYDWADVLTEDILEDLSHWDPTTSQLTQPGSDLPEGVKMALDFLQYLKQQASGKGAAKTTNRSIPKSKYDDTYNKGRGLSERRPNQPAVPSPSTYDPSKWVINIKDADDGAWVCKEAEWCGHKKPRDQTETGFVTWKEQEALFPHLDARLRLHDVMGPNHMIFDPATVDSRVWDPLNRIVAEPKTGTRAPLRLGPITTLSLSRWMASGFGIEYPIDPIQFPEDPMLEYRKRHSRPASLSLPNVLKNKMGKNSAARAITEGPGMTRNITFASLVNKAAPSKEMPSQPTNQKTPVASVHYPLKSPSATYISIPRLETYDDARQDTNLPNFATFAVAKSRPPTPPTPRSRVAMPPTPTVALYEHPIPSPVVVRAPIAVSSNNKDQKPETVSPNIPKPSFSAQAKPEDQVDTPLTVTANLATIQDDSKKRPTEPTTSSVKRRRTSTMLRDYAHYSGSDSGKENAVAYSVHAPSPVRTYLTTTAKPKWIAEEDESSSSGGGGGGDDDDDDEDGEAKTEWAADLLPHPTTTRVHDEVAADGTDDGGSPLKSGKSVRFDLSGGLNDVMRYEAKRAIGRYNLTSRRRGSLDPQS
ncbi:hypothetical protein GGS21DRAFT_6560 [Xylaria nigripes]|nr:hypothetical protein GGS21DRAFT_6560 [Xylaria nigripes]